MQQSTVQRYSKDRLLNMIRQCVPIPYKTYNITKRLKTPSRGCREYFPGFLAFIDPSTIEQQIPRPVDKYKKKRYNY